MSIGFRQREGLERGCPYVRVMCTSENCPALNICAYYLQLRGSASSSTCRADMFSSEMPLRTPHFSSALPIQIFMVLHHDYFLGYPTDCERVTF